MWKLKVLGCIFVLINGFETVYSTPQRIVREIRKPRRMENFVEMVEKYGYLADERFVTTEDGYILSVHRVFGSPKSPPSPNKSLVLLVHGMIASSDVWAMRGPRKDLAFILADEGYDVWLMNVRGNYYSRRHVEINPAKPEFWRFSWHESGVYDMPATIDYMLDQTGMEKVTVVGHSMGSTICYVLLSIKPEYNDKVDLVVALAPVAVFSHQFRGPLTIGLQFGKEVLASLKRNGIYELFSRTDVLSQLIIGVCKQPTNGELCRETFFFFGGSADREQFDDLLIPTLIDHYPAGTSVDTVEHYRQNMISSSFREFDFGKEENYARYGKAIPPEYPLGKITTPVILYYGLNDPLSQPADVKALEKKLPNVLASKVVPHRFFNHFDFIISKDSKELLYNDVLQMIQKYKVKGKRKFF